MPNTLQQASTVPPEKLARINTDQYHEMIKAGILAEGDPIELLDGLLVYKDRSERGDGPMTIGEHHNLAVQLLSMLNEFLRHTGAYMQTQGPVCLPPCDEPEPDGAIIKGSPRNYASRLPESGDVLCIFEVADSSLEFDRTTKLKKYAASGIPQFIIINLVDNQIECFEHPVPAEERYAQCHIIKSFETLSLRAGDEKRIDVSASNLLP